MAFRYIRRASAKLHALQLSVYERFTLDYVICKLFWTSAFHLRTFSFILRTFPFS